MDARTFERRCSMQGIADVIGAHRDLCARAAESTAYEHFNKVIDMLDSLQAEQYSAPNELRALDARRSALMEEIRITLASIEATRALRRRGAAPLPPFEQPSRRLDAYRFSHYVTGRVDLAAEHAAALVEDGLHPRTFDDVRTLIDALIEVDREHAYLEAIFRSFDLRVNHASEFAPKRTLRDDARPYAERGWAHGAPTIRDGGHAVLRAARNAEASGSEANRNRTNAAAGGARVMHCR
ncbi:MAG: hypothetical protein JWM41_258 [Gemmatimonadetes bacterium]|nr:hypothetical protein [Gemmatimonadota bacterium]